MNKATYMIEQNLTDLENTVRAMSARVASGEDVPMGLFRRLRQAAVHLTDFGDQSKNDAFYGLGDPEVDTVDEDWTPPASVTHPGGKTAAATLWKYTCPETEKDFYLSEKKTTVKSPWTGKNFTTKPEKDTMTDVAKEIKSDAEAEKAEKAKTAAAALWKYTCPETEKDFYITEKKTTVKSPYTGKSFTTKPEKDTMAEVAKEIKSDAAAAKAKKTKKASWVRAANTEIASTILTKLASASDRVTELADQGRPFNHAKAHQDIHKLAVRVHTILANEDIEEESTQEELSEVEKQASDIHALFFSARR